MIKKFQNILKDIRKEVMKIYQEDFKVEYKEDNSPLTKADIYVHEKLKSFLTDYPILSEEEVIPYEIRKNWETYWLIDPIDGTKDFVERTGEFTVNIALIEKGIPIKGLIYVIAKDILYYGEKDNFSVRIENYTENAETFLLPDKQTEILTFVTSRSHLNNKTKEFMYQYDKPFKTKSIGSSIKFCLVAEGSANIYPRFGPCMEWDSAAAHAILLGVGKNIYQENGEELKYNKKDLTNPNFIAR